MKKILSLMLAILMVIGAGITVAAAELPDYTISVNGDTAYVTVVDDFFGDVILASYTADDALVDAKIFTEQILTDTKTHEYSIADLDRTGASVIKMFMWDAMQPTEMFDEEEGDWNTISFVNGSVTLRIKIEDDIADSPAFAITDNNGYEKSELTNALSVVTEDGYYVVSVSGANVSDALNILVGGKIARKYCFRYDKAPTVAYAQVLIQNLREKADMLDVLLAKCEAAGISTDYESIYANILYQYTNWAERQTEINDYRQFFYTYDRCMQIYDTAKDDLKAYLEGTKVPFDVPKYVTSEVTNDGTTLYADTVLNDGTKERRPVHFVGYNYLAEYSNEIDMIADTGVNHVQREIGPDDFIFPSANWEPVISGSGITAERSTTRKNSGTYSFRIENTEQTGSVTLEQSVNVQTGKTYYFGLSAYGSGVTGAKVTFNGTTVSIPTSTKFRFQNYGSSVAVAASSNAVTQIKFTVTVTGKVTDLFLDDIYVKEGSTSGENLIINPGFEEENSDKIWRFDDAAAAQFVKELEDAERRNIAVDMLLAPHYIPSFIVDAYDDVAYGGQTTGGNAGWYFGSIDYSAPILTEITGAFLDGLLPLLKDCKAIKTICLMNEPNINLSQVKEKHTPLFQAWLEEKYGTIDALNAAYGGTSYTAFSEVQMPDQSTSDYSVHYFDYREYNCTVFDYFHDFLNKKVKEYLPDIPTHTKLMSTFAESESRGSWNHGTDHEHFAKYTDYNGNDMWMTASSVNSWGYPMRKAMFYDYQHGIKDVPVINSEDHIIDDHDSDMNPQHLLINETDVWMNAFHGRSQSALWGWCRTENPASIMYGAIGSRPDWLAGFAKTSYDLNRLSWEIEAVNTNPEQVAVLYSNTSRAYDSNHINILYRAFESLHYRGYRTAVFTENNLDKIDENIKMVVVPQMSAAPEKVIDELLAIAESGVKIVFVGDNCLTKNEYNQAHTTANLAALKNLATVVTYVDRPTMRNDLAAIADTVCTQKLRVVDADTKEVIDIGEYMCGYMDGDVIVSLVNYDHEFGEGKTVEIYLNDVKLTNMTELRSNEYVGDSITVEPFKPVLIRADVK